MKRIRHQGNHHLVNISTDHTVLELRGLPAHGWIQLRAIRHNGAPRTMLQALSASRPIPHRVAGIRIATLRTRHRDIDLFARSRLTATR